MPTTPAPAPRDLLPPLLACLPTAFVAPRPPPALLPLLSPILRQRVNLLSSSGSLGTDGWLPLLSWDADRAFRLAPKIESLQLEPHPVSGELELQDVRTVQYRSPDPETLQAKLEVDEFELVPIYVWCDNDEEGGRPGWRLAELRAQEDSKDGTQWFNTALEATEATKSQQSTTHPATNGGPVSSQAYEDQDDDDDYWASYDRTPSQTPAHKSPAPVSSKILARSTRIPSTAEQDYYARYSSEVQPALDSHDPDEEHPELGNSTLNGEALLDTSHERPQSRPTGRSLYGADQKPSTNAPHDSVTASASTLNTSFNPAMEAPRPRSPSSSASSRSIERLEQNATDMTQAEVGVKQFVSTEVKSLFRLARSVGISRHEFERIIRTELDVLGMLERDE